MRLPVLHFHIFVVHDYRFSLELEQWSPWFWREVSDVVSFPDPAFIESGMSDADSTRVIEWSVQLATPPLMSGSSKFKRIESHDRISWHCN